MDVLRENMKLIGARVENAEDRFSWKQLIRCGEP